MYAGPQKQRRFVALTSSPELRKAQRGYVSKNTDKSTACALKNFRDWRIARNEEARAFDPLGNSALRTSSKRSIQLSLRNGYVSILIFGNTSEQW